MSEFWRRQLVRFDEVTKGWTALDAATIEKLVSSDYGFEDLSTDVDEPTQDESYIDALKALAVAVAVARRRKAELAGVEKGTWEHARALGFLKREGLLDEYTRFMSPLRIRSTMSTARHWYYARLLDRLIDEHHGSGAVDILEIGGGAGNLAYFVTVLGRVRSYTIIDLPEMLVQSGFTLASKLPQAELVFPPSPVAHSGPGQYRFLIPAEGSELPEHAFDVVLNFNSFMEMDREVRDDYFDLIYRVARAQALFVNVNRRQRALPLEDDRTWDNNPLLYPYRNDEVLLWEEERFQTATRADFNSLPSLTVLRAGIIRPQ